MKILVVEDEHRIASYVKRGLELKGHVVDVAYDGEEGFDMASSDDYGVIVLDRMLPKIDGVEVCRGLRKERVHTPILMLTAKNMVEDRVEGLEAGADDYLGKPFAFGELLARVKALSRRPKKQTEEVLQVVDLELDGGKLEVKRGGKRIELSRREFSLLEYLMRNKGRVMSSEQIVNQVWPYDSEVLPNTAQVYVGYLRKKIDKAFPKAKPLIRTVKGFGYMLEGEGDV